LYLLKKIYKDFISINLSLSEVASESNLFFAFLYEKFVVLFI